MATATGPPTIVSAVATEKIKANKDLRRQFLQQKWEEVIEKPPGKRGQGTSQAISGKVPGLSPMEKDMSVLREALKILNFKFVMSFSDLIGFLIHV